MKQLRFLVAALIMSAWVISADAAERPNLTGRVLDKSGAPLPKASVFVYTASPRVGTSSTCPSCYVDCRKKAQTDADGKFEIRSLDPTLVFRLLVVAGGYEAQFVPKVDPATGSAPGVKMKPIPADALKSATRIAGVVLAEDGKPVVGAVLNVEGIGKGDSMSWGGNRELVDNVAVSDDKGRFLLQCKPEVSGVEALIEGPNVAKRWIKFKPGGDYIVRMEEGGTVTGRIVQEGKPLEGIAVGMGTVERQCGVFLKDFEATTDKNGYFTIYNVTPGEEFNVWARMESLKDRGALPMRQVKIGKSGTTEKLGDLQIERGARIKGRIVLSDGKPVPPKTRLFFGRDKAWDHTEILLGDDGTFEFLSLPKESYSISVRIKGYKFSKANPSLDWLNGGIVGTINKDIEDLVLVMEPGQWRFNREEDDIPAGADRQPSEQPLRSAKL